MGGDQDPVNILAIAIATLVVCPLSVGWRIWARLYQRSRIGVDDALIIPALVLAMGCAVALIIGEQLQVFGYPTPPPPQTTEDPKDAQNFNFTTVEKLEWAFFLMQITAMGLIKLSFVFFFRRVFVTRSKRGIFHYVTVAVIALIITWTLAFFLWFLLSCKNDFAARWNTVNTLHRTCPTDLMSDEALAISDVLTDVIIVFLPIPMVWRLQMKAGKKLAVLGVFGLGSVALIASIVRLALFTWIVGVASGKIVTTDADNNLLTTSGLYWSMLETTLALIACNMPMLRVAMRHPSLRRVLCLPPVSESQYGYEYGANSSSRSRSRPATHGKHWAHISANDTEPSEGGRSYGMHDLNQCRCHEDPPSTGLSGITVEQRFDVVHAL